MLVEEWKIALFIFLVTGMLYVHFVVGTIIQICNELDIYCFSTAKKPKLQ